MTTMTHTEPATAESVWALLREISVRQEERDRILNEKFAETDRKMKEVFNKMGSWDNNHGSFAEEYFFNSFAKGKQNFFGEKFDKMLQNKGGIKIDDEYDILLINGHSVGIVETKFKAHENDIPKVLRKAETFRINFPDYQNHKVYLGLASMAFYPELEEKCIENGIAIIKQVGDTVVINDKHLRAY